MARRLGAESSEVRARLIETAAQILRSEGAAAITARRIADAVGLKRQIVHYYFGTIEELIVAMLLRDEESTRQHYEQALQGEEPLQMIRGVGIDASVRVHEFAALAFRHESIRVEYARSIEEFRRMFVDALTRHLASRGLTSNVPVVVVATMVQMMAQAVASESMLGVSEGHAEINAYLDRWLDAFSRSGTSPAIPD